MITTNLKKIIFYVIGYALIIAVCFLFYLGIYSGKFRVMTFDVVLDFHSQKVILQNYDLDLITKVPVVNDNYVLDTDPNGVVHIWLNDKLDSFDILLSSWGRQGGSTYLGDTTSEIDIKVNGVPYRNLSQDQPVVYRVNKSTAQQIFDINMYFNNNYPLISDPQSYDQHIVVDWLDLKNFERIKTIK